MPIRVQIVRTFAVVGKIGLFVCWRVANRMTRSFFFFWMRYRDGRSTVVPTRSRICTSFGTRQDQYLCPNFRQSWTTSLENLSCSSGRSPQGTQRSPGDPEDNGDWAPGISRRTSRAASYCQCTTTLTGPQRTTQVFATKIHQKCWARREVFRGSLGVRRSWKRREMVRDARMQNRWSLESNNSTENDAKLRGERAPSAQRNQSFVQRVTEESGRRKSVFPLQSDCSIALADSACCQSAQYLRSVLNLNVIWFVVILFRTSPCMKQETLRCVATRRKVAMNSSQTFRSRQCARMQGSWGQSRKDITSWLDLSSTSSIMLVYVENTHIPEIILLLTPTQVHGVYGVEINICSKQTVLWNGLLSSSRGFSPKTSINGDGGNALINHVLSEIQIKNFDTRNQLVDILTNGTFARDEWHYLLRVFNIMVNSVFLFTISVIELTSLLSCRSDGRRKPNMERRKICVIAQSRPTRNLVVCDSQPVLSIWRLQVPFCEAWGLHEKVAQVRVREAQEDLLQRFRARAIRQCLKIQTRIEAHGVLWQDLTSKPPAKKWAYHNLSVSSGNWMFVERIRMNVRQKISLPWQDTVDQILSYVHIPPGLQLVQLHISKCGHTTFGSSGMKMKKVCVCFAHVITLHISPSSLVSYPSLSAPSPLFPHGQRLVCGTWHLIGRWQAHSDIGDVESYLTGYEHKPSDKIITADNDATPINDPDHDSIFDFSKTTHDNTGWFGVPTVCETSVTQISRGDPALQKERKESLTRETEGKHRMRWIETIPVISVGESMSRRSRRNSMRSHCHQTQRDFFSGERDLREQLERRAQQAVDENSVRTKIKFDWVQHEDPEFRTKKFRICITWVATWAWISETTIIDGKSLGRPSSTWEHTFVRRFGYERSSSSGKLRAKLPRNWRIEETLLSRGKRSKTTKRWKNLLHSRIRIHQEIRFEDPKND